VNGEVGVISLIPRVKCMLGRPYRTYVFLYRYPALKRWAKLDPPLWGWFRTRPPELALDLPFRGWF
jgi:hypothetical protein